MGIVRRAVAIAVCFVLAGVPAKAQEAGDPHLAASFDGLTPPVSGLVVHLRNAPPAPPDLDIRNQTREQLLVFGFDREDFVRIGPDGTYANRRSRTFYITQDPTGAGGLPPGISREGKPIWVKVSSASEWRWWEPRARWRGALPPGTATATTPVALGEWTVPARLGTKAVSIGGRLYWKPILGTVTARLVVAPTSAGVTINVLQGPVPGLSIANTSRSVLEVTGRDGRPFARVGPDGVAVDPTSASARDNPRFARIDGSGWHHVQDAPVLSWLERRATYEGEDPMGPSARVRATLVHWTIPATLAGRPYPIQGVTEWIPLPVSATRKASRFPWVAVVAALSLLVIAGGLLGLRRRGG